MTKSAKACEVRVMIVFRKQLSNRVIPSKPESGYHIAWDPRAGNRQFPLFVLVFFTKKRVRDSSFRWNDALVGLSYQQITGTRRQTVFPCLETEYERFRMRVEDFSHVGCLEMSNSRFSGDFKGHNTQSNGGYPKP